MSVSAMKHLSVFVLKNESSALIRCLMDLRCVELAELDTRDEGDAVECFANDSERAALDRKIAKIEDAIKLLSKYSSRPSGLFAKRRTVDLDEFRASDCYDEAWKTVNKAIDTDAAVNAVKNEKTRNDMLISSLEPWLDYDLPLTDPGTKRTGIMLGSLPKSVKIPTLEEALGELAAYPEKIYSDNKSNYISVSYLRDDEDAVNAALARFGFVKAAFKDVGENVTAKKAQNAAYAASAEASKREDELYGVLAELADSLDDIETLCDVERTSLALAEGERKTGMTGYCSLIEGWLPAEKEAKVAKLLDRHACAYEIREPREDENVPVLLKNNGYATTFEWVVGMYSYPKYGTYDPTFIMSIFYFILFGLMFADVGYGLILVLGGLLLPRVLNLKPGTKRAFYMFGYCGISSMIMGVLFGGWFGDLPYAIMENFMGIENAKEAVPFFNGIFINPIDDIMTFFIIALAMGGVHIVAGMITSMVIECKKGNVLGAIFDTGSWLVIFAGIGVAVALDMTAGVIVAGVGVAMIVTMHARDERNIIMRLLKGLLGLYDITSYASDVLSYARILALGLASAVISQVINLLGTMNGLTPVGIVMFILIMLIGHLLNIAINVLGTFVHTSRLQYLEFFGKFFTAGGKAFTPAAPSDKYVTVRKSAGQEKE